MKVFLFYMIAAFALITFGCSDNDHIYLLTDNVNGLKVGDPVSCKGLNIGSVTELQIHDTEVLVSIDITEDLQIPVNSVFKVEAVSLLGDKTLTVGLPKDKGQQFIQKGDTLRIEPSGSVYESIDSNTVKKLLEEIVDQFDKNDQ